MKKEIRNDAKAFIDQLNKPTLDFSTVDRNKTEKALKEIFRKEVGGNNLLHAYRGGVDLTEMFALVVEAVNTYNKETLELMLPFMEFIPLEWDEDLILDIVNPEIFDVLDTASGNGDVIMQALPEDGRVPVKTSAHVVKIYQGVREYLRTDGVKFTEMVIKISDSFAKNTKNRVGSVLFTTGQTQSHDIKEFTATSGYADTELREAISYVAGKNSVSQTIIKGTIEALINLTGTTISEVAKTDLYEKGICTYYAGHKLVAIDQFYDGATAQLPNDKVKISPITEDKFVKYVQRPMILAPKSWMDTNDFKQTYTAMTEDEILIASAKYTAVYDWS